MHTTGIRLGVLIMMGMNKAAINKGDVEMKDKTKFRIALNTVSNLTSFDLASARILLQVNGIENALEYIEQLKIKRNDSAQQIKTSQNPTQTG